MTVHKGCARETPDGVHVGSLLGRAFAAACICTLAGLGVWGAWRVRDEVRAALLALGVTLGPAVVFAMGYFRCLPEIWGASATRDTRTPWRRWSDYARLSAAFAIALMWAGWALYYPTASHGDIFARSLSWEEMLAEALISTSLLLGVIVVSEDYLARSMPRGEASAGQGWRGKARWVAGGWGGAIGRALSPKPSLALGAVLVLMGTFPLVGEMFSRHFEWITAEETHLYGLPARVLGEIARVVCLLAIGVSLLGLISVLAGKRGESIGRSRSLVALSGILALFLICDFTFGWIRFYSEVVPAKLLFGVSMIVWLLPVVLWLWRARTGGERWNSTRLAILTLYLPIFFFTVSFLIPTIQIVPSYVLNLAGLLLLWWGFLQSGWQGLKRD